MEDIHDIKGLIEILPFWREHLVLILILGILIGLGLCLMWYFKIRQKNKRLKDLDLLKLTPYEQAIHDLMDAEEYMKPGFDKELSTKSSDIIRRYLEEAFRLQASERTTEEFLYGLNKERVFNEKILEALAGFLEMCDLAKFAKVEFTHHEQEILFEKANTFLELAHREELSISEKDKVENGVETA